MKTILKEGIAVNCKTEEEAKEFIELLRKDGYRWSGGEQLTKTSWTAHTKDTCYVNNHRYARGGIGFSDVFFFKKENFKIISFAKFKQSLNQHWKSAITEHLIKDNKTIIKLSNGKVGTSNCLPTDKFNEGVGAVIAVAKAYNVDLKEVVKLTEKPKEPKLYYAKDIVGKWAKVKIAGWQDCERKIIFADNKKIVYLYREWNKLVGYTEDKEAFGKTWQLI